MKKSEEAKPLASCSHCGCIASDEDELAVYEVASTILGEYDYYCPACCKFLDKLVDQYIEPVDREKIRMALIELSKRINDG